MNSTRTWLFTGGHHNSALVVALKAASFGDKVIWVGHRQAAQNDQSDSAEYLEVTDSKIPFYELKAGKWGGGLLGLLRFPKGLWDGYQILHTQKPDLVISFGGYLGFTIGVAAILLKIPLFLHEQTVVAGKANKFLSLFAQRTYLTWDSSGRYLPRAVKTKVVGLPLRQALLKGTLGQDNFQNHLPTILVLGGKQGSHILNQTIFENLDSLLSRYNIIHQTGSNSETQDAQKSESLKEQLKNEVKPNYRPSTYLRQDDLITALAQADLVVTRSGAHISYELAILGKPAVMIPYPHTHAQEQLKNAEFLKSHGLATLIQERELTYAKLLAKITTMLNRRSYQKLDLPKDATEQMLCDIRSTLQ